MRRMRLALAACLALWVTQGQAFPPASPPDSLFWPGPLGAAWSDSQVTVHLFAPRALHVRVHLFGDPFGPPLSTFDLSPAGHGCWTKTFPVPPAARYYAYTLSSSGGAFTAEPFADPYARAVVTENHFTHRSRAHLLPFDPFDWGEETWVTPRPEDLIIYEAHVRDLTAHPSSGVPDSLRGTYRGLCYPKAIGGLPYLVSLGVNAVELLPIHEFGNLEVPYRDPTAPVFNTWNPYARNHWGYMTSFFFAPEAYYATGQTLEPGGVCGADGRQVNELKLLVKTLHRNGMAVILDVVYNHVSQYDLNPFKAIDKEYYFRLDNDGNYLSLSGCGNDFRTEAPMARRLIVDSVRYWMEEFHVDGFRFDLATMIDGETLEEVSRVAREINPRVLLIAEPWGGGQYDLARFSRLGWLVWNDRIRNGIKGRHPETEPSFVFGRFLPGEDSTVVMNHLMGSVVSGGGPLLWPWHAVNYLESHDDHTLGDFIRVALGIVGPHERITDPLRHARLTPAELRVHRLAALALFCSQGAIMLAEGQEFGRSKVIAQTDAPDTMVGTIDHNSYAKDNETNWLDYRHASLNGSLVDYYRSLIRLRKAYKGLGGATPDMIAPWATGEKLCVGLKIASSRLGDPGDLLVLLNGSDRTVKVHLPHGTWHRLVVGGRVWGDKPGPAVSGHLELSRTTGALLVQAR